MENSFITALQKEADEINNRSLTENGALGYATSNSTVVDITFALSSYRNDVEKGVANFMKLFKEDQRLATRWLAWASDIREGAGERNLLKQILLHLSKEGYTNFVKGFIEIISEYSRWDNILPLLDTANSIDVCELIRKTLKKDFENIENNQPISLLGKWLPSNNTSSKQTCRWADYITKALKMSPKKYRKMLVKLRKYLDVTETKMCSKKWSEIDYEKVPSKAALIYRNAFRKNDEERYNEYISKVNNGEKKINASVTMPHEIIAKYTDEHFRHFYSEIKPDITLENIWKSIPSIDIGTSTMVVVDTSGSMLTECTKGVTAFDIAMGLGFYFAERCSGPFKNKNILFSSLPHFIDYSNCEFLLEKIKAVISINDCSTTNIERTFDLILETAKKYNLTQSELPKQLLIISDMEFDMATYDGWSNRESFNATLFDFIKDKFKKAGYVLPRLVFWNVNSRTDTIPVKENECGVVLVSGFSPNIVKMVMNENLNSEQCVLDVLNSSRYDMAELAVFGKLTAKN